VLHYRHVKLRAGRGTGADTLLPSIACTHKTCSSRSPFILRATLDPAHPLPMADLTVLLIAELRSHLATLRTELGGLINHAGGEEARGGAN
jgi:hypothetical protein